MRKPSFKKRQVQSEEMSLQITSMADIFVILLVFLLKSYATSAVNVTPSVMLPEAQASEASIEALKVEITDKAVLVEGQPVTTLDTFKFEPADLESNGTSRKLLGAIKKERDRQMMIAKVNTDVKIDARILVIADQKAPYGSIKTVLASAALNGYTDFKLAVVKGE